ncbi:F-box protein At3g07870-like [Papaver somniferum]|uniref:F-box protein At3g07870-like n=1 Tax=Papaver somniferum TaxID=3469 RepID=UPI000E702F64|nr:F-box protein At3g07870-like [Papaver somniferum]
MEILYRLPADSILQCILVCRTWRTLVRNTFFVNNHYLHQLRILLHEQQLDVDNLLDHQNNISNISLGQIFLIEKRYFRFRYVDENYDYEKNNIFGHDHHLQPFDHFYKKLLATIRDSRVQDRYSDYFLYPIGSCNGLLCFFLMYKSFQTVPFSLLTYPMFVCNPITGEYINLPRCGVKEKDFHIGISCGIGYDYSNNVYKVVVALHNMQELELQPNRLQVYIFGDVNGWRSIKSPYDLSGECIHIAGTFFWLDDERCNIVAFDLTDEVFELLPKPSFYTPNDTYYYKLHILRKGLCVVLAHYPNLEIWLVKKKKKLQLNNNSGTTERTETDCWSWMKEFSMSWEGLGPFIMSSYLQPVTILRNGQVLIWDYKKKALFLCDPRTSTAKEIVHDDDFRKVEYVRSLPHINSFVSLKSLGMKSKWI